MLKADFILNNRVEWRRSLSSLREWNRHSSTSESRMRLTHADQNHFMTHVDAIHWASCTFKARSEMNDKDEERCVIHLSREIENEANLQVYHKWSWTFSRTLIANSRLTLICRLSSLTWVSSQSSHSWQTSIQVDLMHRSAQLHSSRKTLDCWSQRSSQM